MHGEGSFWVYVKSEAPRTDSDAVLLHGQVAVGRGTVWSRMGGRGGRVCRWRCRLALLWSSPVPYNHELHQHHANRWVIQLLPAFYYRTETVTAL